ncbi:MAG: DUF1614 domain-containing protein [Proteobacteria bacterium]|nr:DUF1614 domain-containing protein [Pseudomonadota bacterium]MBU1612339.1 DUF1614 domain-containing protein [Pseudomonadota bacterium]
MRQYTLPPGAGLGILFLFGLLVFGLIFVPAHVAGESFERLGLTMLQGLVVLVCMLLWRGKSFIIHVSSRLVPQVAAQAMNAMLFRMQGMEPESEHTGELVHQRIAVSVGGAVVPLCLCAYFAFRLSTHTNAWAWTAGVVALVAVVCFAALKPWPGQGLRLPVFLSPAATAVAAMVLRGQPFAPQAAYIAAVAGTLIGAGLAPLVISRFRNRLDAPLLVIGGPGVFGGLFFATIAAGLFA